MQVLTKNQDNQQTRKWRRRELQALDNQTSFYLANNPGEIDTRKMSAHAVHGLRAIAAVHEKQRALHEKTANLYRTESAHLDEGKKYSKRHDYEGRVSGHLARFFHSVADRLEKEGFPPLSILQYTSAIIKEAEARNESKGGQ